MTIYISIKITFYFVLVIHLSFRYIKQTKNSKNNKGKEILSWIHVGFYSPKLVVDVVAQRGGRMWRCWNRASNFDFAIAIVAGGWASLVPCLPAIMCDCVMYLVWQHLSLQWLRVCCRSGGRPPESHNTLIQRKTCVLPDAHLRLLHDLALGSYGSALYLSSLLKMRILEVVLQ